MKTKTSCTVPLDGLSLWRADKRLLPSHLCTSDNTRRIEYYKKALRIAMKTRLSDVQREYIRLFYDKRMSKTDIGKIFGVGSSTACKTLKASEKIIREYVELFMLIYDMIEQDRLSDDEYGELQGD